MHRKMKIVMEVYAEVEVDDYDRGITKSEFNRAVDRMIREHVPHVDSVGGGSDIHYLIRTTKLRAWHVIKKR